MKSQSYGQSPEPARNAARATGDRRLARRSARARAAILGSTVDLLNEAGYQGLTMEGVAGRARVGKATVYRWWPSKATLVVDALSERLPLNAVPDTGDTQTDLRSAIRTTIATLTEPPTSGILPALAADLLHEPAAAARFREFIQPRRMSVVRILRNAAERGELPSDVDAELLFDIYAGTVLYRALISGEPIGDTLVEQLAGLLMNAEAPRLHSLTRPGLLSEVILHSD